MAPRTWTAVVLCCLVWFVYMNWFAPPPPKVAQEAQTAVTTTEGGPKEIKKSKESVLGNKLNSAVSFSLETKTTQIDFSDIGARIVGAKLKNFHENLSKDSPQIELQGPQKNAYSLATLFTDKDLKSLDELKYQCERQTGKVICEGKTPLLSIKKEFSLYGDYLLDEKQQITFLKSDKKEWGYLIRPLGAENSLSYAADIPTKAWEVVAYQNEKIIRKPWNALPEETEITQGNSIWLAFANRYFATVLVNHSSINPDIAYFKGDEFSGAYLRYPLQVKEGQKDLTFEWQTFVGPKEYSELVKIPGLRGIIDYGMFSIFAFPLLDLLRFFYKFVHNYGLAIILLTILVRMIFYPLSLKSYRSMKAMQKLQPQLTALKEKYKDDAQRFGQEQLALFKTHKVNPIGGCLPMLVQLPVFIALYSVLSNSIELFHAPFFGWIQDLSSKDPYYVFPVLMGISMFLQQKMTPMAGMDPAQQKVMLIMPVVFSFVMFNLPSGLTIYIFLSTLLGILQQVSMNREKKEASEAK